MVVEEVRADGEREEGLGVRKAGEEGEDDGAEDEGAGEGRAGEAGGEHGGWVGVIVRRGVEEEGKCVRPSGLHAGMWDWDVPVGLQGYAGRSEIGGTEMLGAALRQPHSSDAWQRQQMHKFAIDTQSTDSTLCCGQLQSSSKLVPVLDRPSVKPSAPILVNGRLATEKAGSSPGSNCGRRVP